MVILINGAVKNGDLVRAREDYGDYVKVVVDIVTGRMTIGGEWHADGGKILLETGSQKNNLWGGGIDLGTGTVETIAVINLRPGVNESQEILDDKIRSKVVGLIKLKFSKWIVSKH